MACIYVHNNKTYTKEDFIEYLKENQDIYNVKPDFSNIDQILSHFQPHKSFSEIENEERSKQIEETVKKRNAEEREKARLEAEAKAEESRELSDNQKARLKTFIEKQINILRTRILNFESAKERKGFLPKKETLDSLHNLKDALSTLENIDAFFEQAEFIHKELTNTEKFLNEKFDIHNNDHAHILFQILKQLDQYKEFATFLPSMIEFNPAIKEQGLQIDSMYKNVIQRTEELLELHFIEFVKTKSSKKLTEDEIKLMFNEMKDISWQEAKMGGMSNSMNPIIQLYHKHVEETREKVYDETNKHIDEIQEAARKLKELGVQGFDWMFQKINGKKTGRILQRISHAYYEAKRAIEDKLNNEFGEPREYHKGPLSTLTSKQIAENLELGKLKKARTEFMRAEISDERGLRDGENHKYSDEFKAERAKFETAVVNKNGILIWIPKPYIAGAVDQNGKKLSAEDYDKLYKAYRRKYYTETKDVWVLESHNVGGISAKKGNVVLKKMQFVKSEYIEVITEKNGKPTKFADPEYYSLMNDHSATGKAKKEYFDFYTKKAADLLNKVPIGEANKMKGKMFRIKSSLINDIKSIGVFNTLKKGIRNFINPDVIVSQAMLDETGKPIEDVPVAFMGSLRNDNYITSLNKKLEALRAELVKNPNSKEISNKIMLTKSLLLQEENKLSPDELETDMTQSLIKFAQMAENYSLMKEAEVGLLMIRHVLKNTKFYNINSSLEKETVTGKSKVEERIDTYMRMIFYSNSTKNQDKVSKLIQNFNKGLAYKALGLNPFSGINNAIMANINNRIEAFGQQFGFGNKELTKAQLEVTKYITSTAPTKYFGKNRHLVKPTNKFEAMLKKFNWIDQNQIIEDSSTLSKIMFMGITGGEFLAQSSTAIAKLNSQMLTNSKTGETLSVWDAHEFVNGELQLKDGFEYSNNDRIKISVTIKNMNKIIHGNYSENDKVALQETALGQSLMQFKKWMYNFGKSRWGNTYYDETTQSNLEGRYRTLANFIKVLKAGQMYDWESIKASYTSLEDYQKSNFKKLAVESMYWMTTAVLMLMLEALAKGVDDDDEELKMFVNFLRKQSDRIGGELDGAINPKTMYANLKSPVAGMKMLNDFGQLLSEMVKFPVNYATNDTKDLYIQKGPNKGRLKVSKEFQDLIPVANLAGQFDQLMSSGNFYFK